MFGYVVTLPNWLVAVLFGGGFGLGAVLLFWLDWRDGRRDRGEEEAGRD